MATKPHLQAILDAAGARFNAVQLNDNVQVGTDNILPGAVTAPKTNLAAINGTTGNLNSYVVDALNVVNGAITAAKTNIAALNAATGLLNDDLVTTANLVNGAITSVKTNITAIDPSSGNLTVNSVNTNQLVAGAVIADKLAANSVITSKIAAGNITSSHIASNSILTNHIAAGNITTNLLEAAAVTAEKIATNSINATHVVAGSLTADKLNVTTLSAITANLGNVTSGNITSSANVNISGYCHALGHALTTVQYNSYYGNSAGFFETNGASSASYYDIGTVGSVTGTTTAAGKIGVLGIADQSNGVGVLGLSASGTAVSGKSTGDGVGGYFYSNTGTALSIEGNMTINNTNLVTNLNADKVDGKDAADFVKLDQVDVQMSTDGGSSWQNVRFKP